MGSDSTVAAAVVHQPLHFPHPVLLSGLSLLNKTGQGFHFRQKTGTTGLHSPAATRKVKRVFPHH